MTLLADKIAFVNDSLTARRLIAASAGFTVRRARTASGGASARLGQDGKRYRQPTACQGVKP